MSQVILQFDDDMCHTLLVTTFNTRALCLYYICSVLILSREYKCHVTAGVPGVPTCVKVSGTTPNTTTLTWHRPKMEGRSPVTGYRLMIHEDTVDGENEITSHDLPSNAKDIRVTILDPQKAYIFKLAAHNRSGFGAQASCE